MNKQPKRKYDFLVVATLTLLAVVTWGALDLYRNFNKPLEKLPVTSYHTRKLNPQLDMSVLNKIESRLEIITENSGSNGGSTQ
jgi:hypothetical protein